MSRIVYISGRPGANAMGFKANGVSGVPADGDFGDRSGGRGFPGGTGEAPVEEGIV